jgi:CubicO group peptidase (beta-lactamase class C family)
MRGATSVAVALLAAAQQPWAVRAAIPNCPYLGAVFPKPTNLTDSDPIQQALADLDAAFQAYESNPASSPNLTSWSVQVFSASQGTPLWENYHTAPNVNDSYVSKVDGDTIYRLGSVTKIFTILTFLVEAGDKYWNMPITEYIPELAQLAAIDSSDYNQVMNVSWEDVTLGGLASQMAGIVRDCMKLASHKNRILPNGLLILEQTVSSGS